MWKRYVALSAGGAVGIAVVAAFARPGAGGQSPAKSEASGAPRDALAVPVVVELFTSEGCSSCPPADALLARLETIQPVEGARIVPLAFHVDYWDELGWPDPFASPSYTARQRTYASVDGRMYTPQAVVGGRTELVGSDASGLVQAIRAAGRRPRATVELGVRRDGSGLETTVRVGALPGVPAAAPGTAAVVYVALTQAEADVEVRRGENGGRTLHHTAIVRRFVAAGPVGGSGGEVHAKLELPTGIPVAALRVVAFVQRDGRDIVAAETQALR